MVLEAGENPMAKALIYLGTAQTHCDGFYLRCTVQAHYIWVLHRDQPAQHRYPTRRMLYPNLE
jgi:hypothetical protein